MNRKIMTLTAAISLALPGMALAQTSGQTQNGANAAGGATTTATPATPEATPQAGAMAPSGTMAKPESSTTAAVENTASSATGGTYAEVSKDARLSSGIVGTTVTNPQNQDVATIKDIAFGPGGQVMAYILGYGGFLGIGGHYVAVLPSAVTLNWDGNAKQWKAQMNTTADALKSAPQYTYAN